MEKQYSKMYIAVLDEVPDFMTPTLVAHSVLGAHLEFQERDDYKEWLSNSFRKVVLRVNRKEFEKIRALASDTIGVYAGHENTTLGGEKSCLVLTPIFNNQIPNVLKFGKMWKIGIDSSTN